VRLYERVFGMVFQSFVQEHETPGDEYAEFLSIFARSPFESGVVQADVEVRGGHGEAGSL